MLKARDIKTGEECTVVTSAFDEAKGQTSVIYMNEKGECLAQEIGEFVERFNYYKVPARKRILQAIGHCFMQGVAIGFMILVAMLTLSGILAIVRMFGFEV